MRSSRPPSRPNQSGNRVQDCVFATERRRTDQKRGKGVYDLNSKLRLMVLGAFLAPGVKRRRRRRVVPSPAVGALAARKE
jgi:hypothetical protein